MKRQEWESILHGILCILSLERCNLRLFCSSFAATAREAKRGAMSKKVLILAGSPRKRGNSSLLCDEFLKGAAEAQHEVEKISVADRAINYCTGCYSCNRTGKCVQKDDMAEILGKMIAADVIVLASPVYFYTMDAQMKALIDRTVAAYTKISNKDFYLIATAADPNKQSMERTFDGFRGFLDCLPGANERGAIYGSGAWQMGDIKGTAAMQQAYEMGRTI